MIPNDDTSPEPVASNDIVADAKTWLAAIGGERLQTHSANCHKWHSTCLVVKLTREIERLRTLATHDAPAQGSVHGEGTVGQRLVERLSITQTLLDDNERLRAEIDQLRLSAEEREAIEWCIFQQATPQKIAVKLRKLLERLS